MLLHTLTKNSYTYLSCHYLCLSHNLNALQLLYTQRLIKCLRRMSVGWNFIYLIVDLSKSHINKKKSIKITVRVFFFLSNELIRKQSRQIKNYVETQ